MYRVYAHVRQQKFSSPFLSRLTILFETPFYLIFLYQFLHNAKPSAGLLIRQRSSDPATDQRIVLSGYSFFF